MQPAVCLTATTLLTLCFNYSASAQDGGQPGDFDYYALVLSWSPTYCATRQDTRTERQCDGQRPYAFVLHGLWPQYERGWPAFCRTHQRPWVPRTVVNTMLDIIPSKRLVIHQYKKHGTCSGMLPKHYFKLSRRYFNRVKIPAQYVSPSTPISTSPQDLKEAFLIANPSMSPNMMSVRCGSRKRLREVTICMTRDGRYRACGRNEYRNRCKRDAVVLPPVRGRVNRSKHGSAQNKLNL